jgi:hypothetical protein
MTTGRINQVTTFRPKGQGRPQRDDRVNYRGRRNESIETKPLWDVAAPTGSS